ncbi:MAG: hypothetical protein KDD60_07900, partial [Bdellovibrionales bacterium]|nr:hypothetical protein [Bdellovibrionales bacterium]
RASARVVNPSTLQTATSDLYNNVDYYNLRLLWRAGLSAEMSGFRFGLAATTPSISLAGDATVDRDFTLTGYDFSGDRVPDGIVANDRQDNLDAEFRSPASLAAGVEFDVTPSTRLGLTAEWFGGVGTYEVVNAKGGDFVRPVGLGTLAGIAGSDEFLKVVHGSDSVVNFAVGVEQDFCDSYKGYFAIRTDFENAQKLQDDTDGITLGYSDWDIYHVTTGLTYEDENSILAVGLEYSFGSEDRDSRDIDLTSPSDLNFLFGPGGEAKYNYDEIKLLFGYTYFFGSESGTKS